MRKRTCKKAASLALALAMAVSVCTTALAEGDTEQTTTEAPSISEQTQDNGGEDEFSTQSAGEGIATYDAENQLKDGATLKLDEFNALTEIPEGVTELTVDIGEQTLSANGTKLVIGSQATDKGQGKDGISDYHYHKTTELTEEDKKHLVGYHGESTTDAILTTDKPGITLHIKGTITSETVNNPNELGNNGVQFYLPDKSTVIFDDMTISGTLDVSGYWQQIAAAGYAPEATTPHQIDTIEFKDCTINGSIYKNGGNSLNLVFEHCTFNKFTNTAYPGNTYPIWYKNSGIEKDGWRTTKACKITVHDCIINANRPLNLTEEHEEGVELDIRDNVFNMSQDNPTDAPEKPKNDAVLFSAGSGKLSKVTFSNNTIKGATAIFARYVDDNGTPRVIDMADGGTFTGENNIVDKGTKLWVEYKKTEENGLKPDFVNVEYSECVEPAPDVEVSDVASSVRTDGVTDETLIAAANTVGVSSESVSAVKDSDAVAAVKADAEKTYKNEDNTWNGTKLQAALAGSVLANEDVSSITLVTVPYLAVTPKQTDAKGQLTFNIELLCDLRATTDPDNMDANNTCTISTTNISENAPTVTIQLSVGSAFTADQLASLYVKHDSAKGVRYYDTTIVDPDKKTISFENPDGYSDFTVTYSTDEAVVDFAGTSKTLNLTSLNDKTLPAPAKTENFLGWQFAGVDGTYTELDEALLAKLAAAYKAAGKPLTATAQYKAAEQPSPAPSEAPKPSAAPTAAPAAAPAATATPAPTAAPAANNKYYTCTACGHHNWTATSEGYKCDTCGHLETKQLSGYANVKGVYTPQSTSAAKAAKATTIPQTSDEMPIVPIAIVSLAALLGLGVTAYLKKKQN